MAELVDFLGLMRVYGFRTLSSESYDSRSGCQCHHLPKAGNLPIIYGKKNLGCVFDDKSFSVARYDHALHIVNTRMHVRARKHSNVSAFCLSPRIALTMMRVFRTGVEVIANLLQVISKNVREV